MYGVKGYYRSDEDDCPYCDMDYTNEGGRPWNTVQGPINMVSDIEGSWSPEEKCTIYHIHSKLVGILEGITIPSAQIEYCPKCGRYLYDKEK